MTTARGPQHAVAEPVALLQHLDHGSLLRLGRLREQRLLRVRVELPVGRDLRESLLRERVGERAVHQADAVLELRLLVLGRGLERALEVVEHRARARFTSRSWARAASSCWSRATRLR